MKTRTTTLDLLRYGLLLLFLLGFIMVATLHADKTAKDEQGWLGVYIEELTPSLKKELDVGSREGILISEVIEDSPADDAGLKDKDIILEFDGIPVSISQDFIDMVRETEPDKTVNLKILRRGKEQDLEVTIGKKRKPRSYYFLDDDNEIFISTDRVCLGVEVTDLNEDLAQYFKVDANDGVLVLEVYEDSPAEKAGLKAGDIITKLDTENIKETEDLIEILDDYEDEDKITVEYVRLGKKEKTTAELEEIDSPFNINLRLKGLPPVLPFTDDFEELYFRHPGYGKINIYEYKNGKKRLIITEEEADLDELKDLQDLSEKYIKQYTIGI